MYTYQGGIIIFIMVAITCRIMLNFHYVIIFTPYSDEELPSFPVDSAYLKAVRQRVSLARQLHSLEHQRNKAVRAEQWISKSAKAMDIEIDEDLYPK